MERANEFFSEWKKTITSLEEMNASFKEFKYFTELARQHSDIAELAEFRPRVILLGHCFPDEIVRALGETPCYLLGGSFASASVAEDIVPRDTDSAIKSILGMLVNKELHLSEDAIVLLPLTGDSMRKLPDLLGSAVKVVSFELPSDKNNALQAERFEEEILRVTRELERHLKRRLSARALRMQSRLSERAAQMWSTFLEVSRKAGCTVSGSAGMLIAESYHWCSDKADWTLHLERLSHEIAGLRNRTQPEFPHQHVMLLGSPIYAPNYKVPFLVEEMALEIYSIIHPNVNHLTAVCAVSGSRAAMCRSLARYYLDADMSTAFIQNTRITDAVTETLDHGNVDGIIVHILKGQIEYDFELNRIEKLIEDYQLPIFRLETDYNYQDVEQLRIRLEAFAEMLRHRAGVENHYVKEAI